jgi:hypothetical protein
VEKFKKKSWLAEQKEKEKIPDVRMKLPFKAALHFP